MDDTEKATAMDTPEWIASPANTVLKLQEISKSYDSDWAVRNIDLELFNREFVTLLGPVECGKSTILRLIAGLETPTGGRVLLDGSEISATPPQARSVNMVFPTQALFPHLSVEQNMAFGLKQERMPAVEIRSRVKDMLSFFHLDTINRRRPHQILKQQKLRVALARALARKPKLLLLDDPLRGFDKSEQEELLPDLRKITDEAGVTILMATCDRDTAMTVSTRIAVMNQGQVIQTDTPSKIHQCPATSFVARYVADMNILQGESTGHSGGILEINCAGIDAMMRIGNVPDQPAGKLLNIGLRPEKIRVQRDKPMEQEINALPGTISDISHSGNRRIIHVALSDGTVLRSAQTDWNEGVSRSDKVWLHWPIDAGVLLPS